MKKISIFLFLIIFFSSCVKDKPGARVQPQVKLSDAKKVYVVNEGPFKGSGNGAVSLYDPATGEVIENFYEVQNKLQLGNVAQSMTKIGRNYYIVVNNANKIIVCDEQFRKIDQIDSLTSPRYILPVTNQKAYVSDLYANELTVVDLNSNSKKGSIRCPGKTERMVLIYNKAFVTNWDKEYVYIVNTLLDAITDSIFVGSGAASIVTDKNDYIWVLASGNGSTEAGRLTRIDAISNKVESVYLFGVTSPPGNLCLNRTGDTLYFLNGSVYRMCISDMLLPVVPFIDKGPRNFYGLGVNPNDHTIYASDALDYSQRSQVYIFNSDGSLKGDFKAGIIANCFYFE